MVVLPTPGPPVMTSTLDISASRMAATWLSARVRPVFCSTHGNALSGSMQGQGSVPLASRMQPLGDHLLGPVETGQKHAGRLAHPVGDHAAFRKFQIERRPDQLLRHLEQFCGQRHQFLRRQAAVTLVHGLGQAR